MPKKGSHELLIEHTTYDASHPSQNQSPTSPKERNSSINFSALGNMLKREDHELLIEHLTYDASHPTPTSNQKQRTNEQDSSRTPPTPTEAEDIVTYIMTQQRLEKAAQKTTKTTTKSNPSGRYLHLPSPKRQNFPSPTRTKTKTKNTHPQLRRKEKFSGVMLANFNRTRGENETENNNEEDRRSLIEHSENMQRFADVREKIREGKLERTIPPWSKEKEDSLAPPPRRQRPTSSRSAPGERFLDLPPSRTVKYASQSAASSDRNIKEPTPVKLTAHRRSPARKLAAYVEKGREVAMQSKFHSPFEHIHYPSFSRKSSCFSDSSFFCTGEELQHQSGNENLQAFRTDKRQNEPRRRRRISGDGTSPWYDPVPVKKCRLCTKPGTQGIKGLCSDCEQDFVRPTTTFGLSLPNLNPASEQEIKPTPPLKDRKTLEVSLRKSLPPPPSPNPFQDIFSSSYDEPETERIILPLFNKENVRIGTVPSSKPVFRTVDLSLIAHAQWAEIEEVEEIDSDVETMLRWEKGPFSPATSPKERLKKDVFEGWAARYSSERYEKLHRDSGEEEEDMQPLIPRKEVRKKGMNRDTMFYEYWDELLG